MQKLAVVYFPSQNFEDINQFRQKYDPNWYIIPPHITIVSPLTDIPEDLLLQHITKTVKKIKPFTIHLNKIAKSFDNDYLFLLVSKNNQKIIDLYNKLYSGLFKSSLQDNIPFIPHITLGYFGVEDNHCNSKLYEIANNEIKKMNIDIYCNFDSLTLIQGDEVSPAKIIKIFTLG